MWLILCFAHQSPGTFERLDGNAVMVSGYNRDATIQRSDFAFLGGNAVAVWGYTNETSRDPGRPGIVLANVPRAGVDGTDGAHPVRTTVQLLGRAGGWCCPKLGYPKLAHFSCDPHPPF